MKIIFAISVFVLLGAFSLYGVSCDIQNYFYKTLSLKFFKCSRISRGTMALITTQNPDYEVQVGSKKNMTIEIVPGHYFIQILRVA